MALETWPDLAAMASSPMSVCSSLSSADSERIHRLERRVMQAAQKQVEKEVLEELRHRDYEEKLRARHGVCSV